MTNIDLATQLSQRPASPVASPAPRAPAPEPPREAEPAQPAQPVSGSSPPEPDLNQAVGQLNDLIQTIRRELQFSVDESSGQTVITVIDVETQQVVRQIPPQEVVHIIQSLEARAASLTTGVTA